MRKATIIVRPKAGILDPNRKPLSGRCSSTGVHGIESLHLGEIFELVIGDDVTESALTALAQDLLANPVMEDFEITLS
jgi:phosphoribosylformylglycinamidine synthase